MKQLDYHCFENVHTLVLLNSLSKYHKYSCVCSHNQSTQMLLEHWIVWKLYSTQHADAKIVGAVYVCVCVCIA